MAGVAYTAVTTANAQPRAIASSNKATGMSATFCFSPNRRNSRPANAAPTAAALPRIAPVTAGWRIAEQIAAPHKPPEAARNISDPGNVRSGVNGNLSATNSSAAKPARTLAVVPERKNSVPDSRRRRGLREAAWLTAAGPRNERSPATAPIAAAKANAFQRVMFVLYRNPKAGAPQASPMILQVVSTPRAASQILAGRVVATPFAMRSTGLDSRLGRRA